MLQRMVRRRLNVGTMRTAALLKLIRERRPDAPGLTSKYDLMEWFCHQTPLPKSKGYAREERVALAATHPASPEFLWTPEWRRLRLVVLKKRGRRCECCGATPTDGKTVINVDHIKPRRKYPDLALVEDNLQVLCDVCNHGKGNWDETDWRAAEVKPSTSESPRSFTEPAVIVLPPGIAAGAFISAEQPVRVRGSQRPAGLNRKQHGILARAGDMTPRLVKTT